MKLEVIAVAIMVALASSGVQAQTLGESVVAGNDKGANLVPESSAVNSQAMNMSTITNNDHKQQTPDDDVVGPTPDMATPGMDGDDDYLLDDANNDTTSRTPAPPSSETSGSSRIMLATGATLVAIAVGSML